jgi:general secretion pathway protein G
MHLLRLREHSFRSVSWDTNQLREERYMETHIEEVQSKRDKGFTLVELLIVIVILGVLATVTVFAVQGITSRGAKSACDAEVKTVEVAVEAYYAQNNAYPANLAALDGVFLKSTPDATKISYNASTGEVTKIGTCATAT